MATTSASLGDKPADPYTVANKDETDPQTLVTDLVDFITKCKFGMLTTVEASSHNNLVSRCMGLAGTVSEDAFIDIFAIN
jgi:hypothetical protein